MTAPAAGPPTLERESERLDALFTPTFDVVAFLGGAVCVFIACMCAAFIPSRRVAQTDPSSALRHD